MTELADDIKERTGLINNNAYDINKNTKDAKDSLNSIDETANNIGNDTNAININTDSIKNLNTTNNGWLRVIN